MSAKQDSFKVGLVTVIVVVAFFAILIWISQHVGGDMQTLTIRFRSSPDMPTLVPGSAIYVGGYRIGTVTATHLEPGSRTTAGPGESDQTMYLMVEADVRSDLVLRKDCRIIAEGPPLGGDGILKIDLGFAADKIDLTKPIDGDEPGGLAAVLSSLQCEFDGGNPTSLLGQIKSQLDPDSELSLIAKIHRSLGDLNQMTAALANELEPDQKATLLAKLHEVADHVNATTAALHAEMANDKPEVLLSKIHVAMDTLNAGLSTATRMLQTNEAPIASVVENVQATTEHIANETDPERAESLMAHFKKAGTTLNTSLDDIQQVTSTTREVILLNRENINRLLINFKEASDHIKTGVKFVLRHPWRLINEPALKEIKQQAIFDAARSFTEAATRIDDATAQLKSLSDLYDGEIPADNADLARILKDLKDTQSKYEKAEKALWDLLDVK